MLYSSINLEDAIHDCVGLALGVAGISSLIRNIATGPTIGSAIGILKWVGKRYLSYIGIAWMVWDFTSCMGHFDYD
jgi:threonine/homoserine/homoserine lactone efflux protein